MKLSIDNVWLISSALLLFVSVGFATYEGSAFMALLLSMGLLVAISVLGIVLLILHKCRLNAVIAVAIVFPLSLGYIACAWLVSCEDACRRSGSDPDNDFKRFVMGEPHWPDEDVADPNNSRSGYSPADHPLPDSVRVIKSRTFSNFDADGAAVYFQINQKDLASLLVTDALVPSTDPRDFRELDRWTGWYLWTRSTDLGPNPTLYVRKNSDIEPWFLAVNQSQDRALFLYLNEN